MRKFLLVLLLFISFPLFSQVTPGTVKRIANSTTTFIWSLSSGDVLCDISTGKTYRILTACVGTNSLSSLVQNTDYVEIFGIPSNDQWFQSKDATGAILNAWKISKDNNLIPGTRVELPYIFKQPDTWSNIINVPITDALYGDTVGYRLMIDDQIIAKIYRIADGAGTGTNPTFAIDGTLTVDSILGYAKLTDVEGLRDTTNLRIDSTKLRLTDIEDDTTNWNTAFTN
jgi:hypothetical protein